MEKPVTVLPEPDSPTRPSTRPLPTLNETSSTAFTTPARVKKCVCSPRTSSVGSRVAAWGAEVSTACDVGPIADSCAGIIVAGAD